MNLVASDLPVYRPTRKYLTQADVLAPAWSNYEIVETTGGTFVSKTSIGYLDYASPLIPTGWPMGLMDEIVRVPQRGTILRTEHAVLVFDADYAEAVAWLATTVDRLARLVRLDPSAEDGRDQPTSEECAVEALIFLSRALPPNAAPPSLAPLNDGGVQAEWHRGGLDVEVIFSPSEDERGMTIRDKATGTEQDIPLDPDAFRRLVSDKLNLS